MSTPKKKSTTKKTTPKASKPEEGEAVEEFITDDEAEEPNKAQELWGTFKDSVSKIPHGIEEKENKLKLTTSKLFALTGALVAFFEGRHLFLSYITEGTTAFSPIVGAIGMLFGLFLLTTVLADLILAAKAIKGMIPYEWYILLPSGMLLFFLNVFASQGGYLWIKGGVILMIGGIILLLEGLKWENTPKPKVLVSLIGIAVGIYESIRVMVPEGEEWNEWAIITGILMIIILILLFFATEMVKLPEKIRPPLSWWFALCVSVAMYYFGFQLSGAILIHVFLLELIDL